ncbi:MAG: OmpA family protein [bacterium]|nr:OmpA family protein [bacterium]
MLKIYRTALFLVVLQAAWALPAAAQFSPPRIRHVINPVSTGLALDHEQSERRYYIDRGQAASINKGDVLNVYREKRIIRGSRTPMRVFIGTMNITDSQQSSSVGVFVPNDVAIAHPMIRYKTAMKSDIVVPRLVIDNGVLFDPGDGSLKPGAAEEFAKVADFVRLFSPAKLVIEGHTDADGDADANLTLSLLRATNVKNWLVAQYDFITAQMIDAKGFGEEQPIVSNDTPENRQLNRRIEVLIWE